MSKSKKYEITIKEIEEEPKKYQEMPMWKGFLIWFVFMVILIWFLTVLQEAFS